MTLGYTHRKTCRACGGSDLPLILGMAPTPPGDHYVTAEKHRDPQPVFPLDLVMCRTCGLAQLHDTVDPEMLYRDYIYSTSISLGLMQHFDRYAESVLAEVAPPAGSLVVDIGSNDGTLLASFAKRGMRVLGIDPAQAVARKATEAGIETLPLFFSSSVGEEVRRERGPSAIVTANNVFANVDDLDDLMTGIRRLLAPDGVFVFETGYFPDLVRHRVIDNIYHEHLTYYAVKPLMQFFKRHGMELVTITHEATKGGSIRGFVRLTERASGASPGKRDELLRQEVDGGFDRPDALRPFADDVANVKRDIQRCVDDLKGQGRTLAGYGASVGVTTLLYYFDLGQALSFMADDNVLRQGLFTPGHHIPVLPPDALYERKPDDVFILAWRYADPIMTKQEAYRQAGGRFIIPLPEMSIV